MALDDGNRSLNREGSQSSAPVYARQTAEGWQLLVRVQPGARKSGFTGLREGRLCVKLSAPAVDNKANEALCAFLAASLGVRAARVKLVSGATGRQKKILVETEAEPDWSRIAAELSGQPG